ncbi:MAG: hypothetical protein FJX89_08585 [Bacteroidetes bacterium]|nr:hypothetical protein [Bacteroidota bacterium]
MKKFQVTIHFFMDDDFMQALPEHRQHIDTLIREGVIDLYVVTMESLQAWITFTAASKKSVEKYLRQSPLFRYWNYEIAEIFVVDGPYYRLPVLQMN